MSQRVEREALEVCARVFTELRLPVLRVVKIRLEMCMSRLRVFDDFDFRRCSWHFCDAQLEGVWARRNFDVFFFCNFVQVYFKFELCMPQLALSPQAHGHKITQQLSRVLCAIRSRMQQASIARTHVHVLFWWSYCMHVDNWIGGVNRFSVYTYHQRDRNN